MALNVTLEDNQTIEVNLDGATDELLDIKAAGVVEQMITDGLATKADGAGLAFAIVDGVLQVTY